VPAEFRDLVLPSHNTPSYYGSRFMGFYVVDPRRARFLGQFPHFLPPRSPSATASTGSRRSPGDALLDAARPGQRLPARARLFGRTVAAAGTLLLAINLIEVWFSGYPNAEVVAQTLLFAAMLAWSRAQVDGLAFFGVVAASLLGMLLVLRVDMVIALAASSARPLGRAAGLAPVVGFFPSSCVARRRRPVSARPDEALHGHPADLAPGAAAWQMGSAGWLRSARCRSSSARRSWRSCGRLLPWVWRVMAVAAVAAVIYAYFFRVAGGRLAEHDAIAVRSFAWYVMPLGLFTGLVGYVAALRRFAARDSVFLLTVTAYAAFFFYKIRIVPVHYWMTRRFLPIILPARCCWWPSRHSDVGARTSAAGPTAPGPPPAWAVVAILAVLFWTRSSPLLGHVEYAGVIPALEQIAGTFGDRDLVIVESRDASTSTCWRCRWPTSTPATSCCCPIAVPTPRRWSASSPGPRTQYATGLLRRRRRHRAPDAGNRGRADRHRGVPGAGVVVGLERAARRATAQGVRLQRLPLHRPAGDAGRRSSPSTSASTTTSTCCASTPRSARQRHHLPLVARRLLHQPAGRDRRRSHDHAGDGRRAPAGARCRRPRSRSR
jgi:hypothetical protein